MHSRLTKTVVAGSLVTVALVGAGSLVPSVAAAATAEGSALSRVDRITEALAGLVTDGTLTQEQADRVATTLDEAMPQRGPGHHGGHGRGGGGLSLETAAETLGLTVDELRTALREGQTLGEVADAEGVSRDSLVDALVAEAEERLDAAVADGRLTQEQADARRAQLPAHLTEHLDRSGPRGGHSAPPPAAEEAPEQSADPQVEGSSLTT